MTLFESLPLVVCPNCFELADGGLYSAELFQVTHCGCFYEGEAEGKLFHISTEPELTQEEY